MKAIKKVIYKGKSYKIDDIIADDPATGIFYGRICFGNNLSCDIPYEDEYTGPSDGIVQVYDCENRKISKAKVI